MNEPGRVRAVGGSCEVRRERQGGRPAVLVIAATDSSGGAGITRDVQVLADFSVDALCVITAVTAQSDSRLTDIHHIPAEIIRAQIAAALQTRPVGAIKIGMLGTRATVDAVIDSLPPPDASIPLVLDPVLVSSSGGVLLEAGGRDAMLKGLFPRATLVTPNVPEAAALLQAGIADSERALVEQAQSLLALGPQAVLVKGGHASGAEAVDLLISRGGGAGSARVQRIPSPRLSAARRGTGCALASAIAAGIASGVPLLDACREAKHYVGRMLARQ